MPGINWGWLRDADQIPALAPCFNLPAGISKARSDLVRRADLHEPAGLVSLVAIRPAAFYLKSVAPSDISLGDTFKALVPFIALQILAVSMLIIFPGITGH